MGFLGDLGKVLVKTATLIAVGEVARKQLNKLIKNQIRTNAVKLLVFLVAMLISYTSLFGKNIFLLISSVLILGILIHSAIGIIFKIPFFLTYIVTFPFGIIVQSKSPAEIITKYVTMCHPWVFGAKDWLYKAFGGRFNGILPTVDDLVDYIWGYIGKQAIVFGITLVLYIVLFNFSVKPMLQLSILGVTGLKMYLIPFAMAVDFIFKTELMRWVIL